MRFFSPFSVLFDAMTNCNGSRYHNLVEEAKDLDLEDDDDIDDRQFGIFDDIPKLVQYADAQIFGEPLFKYAVSPSHRYEI